MACAAVVARSQGIVDDDQVTDWRRRAAQHARRTLMLVVDWALPPRCAACGVIVLGDPGFCSSCWATLHFLGPPACARCDRPFAAAQGDGALCGGCMDQLPPYDRVHAAIAYGPIARGVVLRFKYGRRTALAKLLARLMRPALLARRDALAGEAAADAPPPILVPVPLHYRRLWARGFNQAVEIGRTLARDSGLALVPDALERTRPTPSMRGQGRRARATAVRGAFRSRPARQPALAGRTVFLVDDVFTTGATAASCARALRRGGAARVELLVFARVLDDDGADLEGAGPGGDRIDSYAPATDMIGAPTTAAREPSR
jgi:ComF family protein